MAYATSKINVQPLFSALTPHEIHMHNYLGYLEFSAQERVVDHLNARPWIEQGKAYEAALKVAKVIEEVVQAAVVRISKA